MPPIQLVQTEIDLGDRIVPVCARINRRARRLIVRVDSLTGTVHITAPSKRSLPDALKFARERASWIRAELLAGPKAQLFEAGGLCPYRGIAHVIVREGGARQPIRVRAGEGPEQSPALIVGGEAAHLNRRLTDWLKRKARAVLIEKSDYYCNRLGVVRGKIRIGDTRSRWGSCSEDGVLSYSWRLILAPDEILNYVAAHECSHLVHLDHSPAYWRVLAGLDVDAKAARAWFRTRGAALFAYGA